MGILSFLLGPQIPPQPPAEPDWQAGDIAECITKGGHWIAHGESGDHDGPKYKQILKVAFVSHDSGTIWLAFAPWQSWFPAGHFRKIRPATDTEFMKSTRREREPVSA